MAKTPNRDRLAGEGVGKIHCRARWVEEDCDRFREVCAKASVGGRPEYQSYL